MRFAAALAGFLLLAACAVSPAGGVDEAQDFGVPPTNAIRVGDYEAPTPLTIDGATTITTPELRQMIAEPNPPLLIDVLGGRQSTSLPGAVWLPDDGAGTDMARRDLASHLERLTHGDKTKAIVFFCLSKTCWLSHNAAVRAVALGYKTVYWYRGGRTAWQEAGLAMPPIKPLLSDQP